MNYIYVLITIGIPIEEQANNKAWPTDYKERVVCWYRDLDKIEKILNDNLGDINEDGYYNFAVVEKTLEGLYNFNGDKDAELWYKWDKEKENYQRCNKPRCFDSTIGFGIG
jgi:plasmid replication initiation protein